MRELKGNWKDKVRQGITTLFGNRITVASRALLVGALWLNAGNYTLQKGGEYFEPLLQEIVHHDNYFLKPESKGMALGGLLALLMAAGGESITNSGRSTRRFYDRTRKHIENNLGELDPRYVKTIIEGSENGSLLGYCQLQGVYLAAREFDRVEVFNETKREYSKNKIPNF